jgi:hypothetical protein
MRGNKFPAPPVYAPRGGVLNPHCEGAESRSMRACGLKPIKDWDTSSRKLFNEGDSDEDVILYLLHEIQAEKPYFHPFTKLDVLETVICLRPRMNNPRIIRQDGYFFVYGINGEKKFPAQMSKEWIVDDIEILKDDKPQINNELDMLNINESFLFPDYRHFANMVNEKYAK